VARKNVFRVNANYVELNFDALALERSIEAVIFSLQINAY
jgi:hypothetical protein